MGEGQRALMTSTCHFLKGDPQRGCAGFDFDTAAAREHTFAIRCQVEQVFGADRQSVYPLVCGFETDEDALILHGQNGALLDASSVTETETLPARLQALFPDMPEQMRADLLPLVQGNIRHVAEVRRAACELDIEHREWMICLGRGFDWLHMPNQALIIGPYSPDLAGPCARPPASCRARWRGRIPGDGFLLLASVPYAEIGVDRARAELKSRFLSGFAAEVITREFPQLAEKMHRRTAVLNWGSRNLEMLDGGD